MPVILLEPQLAAWTDENAPAVAHGGEAEVRIEAVAANRRYGMFKFDIASLPLNITIIDSTLRFYFSAVGPSTELLGVYKCTSAWNEAVDWNNNPTVDGTPLSVANTGVPVANTWESFTDNYAAYDADVFAGIGSPRWHMQRQVQRWYDATDVNHGVLLKTSLLAADNTNWVIVGRTGEKTLRPILEITYATQDTLPASAGGDRRAFVGDALDELNSSHITDVDFSVVIELDPDDSTKDLDVTDDFIAGPTLRRRLPFINEPFDMGNFNFQLNNEDGKYSPTNRDSDLWLNRALDKNVVVKATVKGQEVIIYEGVIIETPQHGDKRVEILTTPRLRQLLDYSLETPLISYTADPWLNSTLTNFDPAELFYNMLHNYVGVADAGINLGSFVAAQTEWQAQGLIVHATWEGKSAWDEIAALQRATLGALYQDFQGRFSLKAWVPSNPTTVDLNNVKAFRWDKSPKTVKNHIKLEYQGVYSILSGWNREEAPEVVKILSDPESIADWNVRHLDVNQQYIRTAETANMIGRLYYQALADPVEKLNDVTGDIGWIQHDLDDPVRLVSADERIDEKYRVIQQDIDIIGRSVQLNLVKANWPMPRRDFVNTVDWFTGAVAEAFTAGLASPVPDSVTGPTLLNSGMQRISIGWTYSDTEIPNDGFAVFINQGATDPGVPTLASHDSVAFYPKNMRGATFDIVADQHISFAIASFRGTEANPYYGNLVTSAAAPDWQNQTLDGAIIAASVPSNVPVFAAGAATSEEDGSTEYKITWTYAQGAITADGFFVLGRFGNAAPGLPTLATNDMQRVIGPDARSTEFRGSKMTTVGSFAVVAYRNTVEGPAYTAVITNAGWTDLQADTNIKIRFDLIRMPSDTTVTADDFLASIIIFKDQYWNAGGAADATTPPERTFSRNIVGPEVYFFIKSTFRKRTGYNLLRLTGYVKMLTTWAPTAFDIETRIQIMNYDGTIVRDASNNNIVDAAYTRRSHDMDISARTDGEIYQVWIGYAIEHQAGGAGQSDVWIWAPIVEVRPD